MSPVDTNSYGPRGRGFHGAVMVGRRGQVAIPAKARGDLRTKTGVQLVVLTDLDEGIMLIPLELLLSRRDSPVTELVRSMLPGVTRPDNENAGGAAGEHANDTEKIADDGGDSR